MPGFMVSHAVFFFRTEGAFFLFRAGHHPVNGRFKIRGGHRFPVFAGSQNCRLIGHVGQVSAHKARCSSSDNFKIQVIGQFQVPGVDFKDFHPAVQIGFVHHDLPVKTPGAQKRFVQHIRSIGGRQYHHAFIGIKTVHLHQELIQCLLAFIMAAHHHGTAALAADGIQFVNKNNTRRLGPGLLKKIPHPGRTDAHKHFDKIRAADVKKRHARLPGYGPGQQCFARAGRAHQQHAFGHAPAQVLKTIRIAQKFDNLHKLLLGLIHPGGVFKGDLR